MADPTQKGTTLIAEAAPTTADYIVVEGSWKETDALSVEDTKDHNGELINKTGCNPGIDAQCDLVIKATKTPPAKLSQLNFTRADGTTVVKFTVVDVETSYMGGKPVKCSVKLEHRNSMTYV